MAAHERVAQVIRWIPALAGALALAAAWGHGYRQGHAIRDAQAQTERAAAIAEAAERAAQIRAQADRAEAARIQAERERDDLRAKLDEESRADADADGRAFTADSLRRIGAINSGP
jgi:hypothetical protein